MNKKLDITGSITPTQAPHISKSDKEMGKEKLSELIKEESRVVRGIFQCFETPGATVKVTVKKYPGIPHFEKEMTDGYVYEVPLYVARHLNGIDASAGAAGDPEKRNRNIGSCSYPIHGFVMSNPNDFKPSREGHIPKDGASTLVPVIGIERRVKRFGFQSMEFGVQD